MTTSNQTTSNPICKYDREKQVFCLSMAAMMASMSAQPGNEAAVEGSAAEKLIGGLSAKQALIGKWTIVWGPEVYQYDEHQAQLSQVGDSQVADNLVYMVKSEEEPGRYVIAIAGTNINSLYDWFIEDLSVGTTKLWNNGKPWEAKDTTGPSGGGVSLGVSKALKHINDMVSTPNAPLDTQDLTPGAKTLVGYLSDLVSNQQEQINELTICGHSLGGALAPVLALSLEDRRSEWDTGHKVQINVSASAGFSPGNQEFASYYDGKLGNATQRIWNSRDLVPKGWSRDKLEEAKTMYQQGESQTNEYINGFINYMKGLTGKLNYQQICEYRHGFNAPYDPAAAAAEVLNPMALPAKKLIKAVIIPSVLRKLTPKTTGDIKVEIKEIFSNLQANGTLGDRPTTNPQPTLTSPEWTRAQSLSQLIEALLPHIGSASYTIPNADLHGQTTDTANNLFGLLKYVWQVYHQHGTAYITHLGVLAFFAPPSS